jgi:hypothetical protein
MKPFKSLTASSTAGRNGVSVRRGTYFGLGGWGRRKLCANEVTLGKQS